MQWLGALLTLIREALPLFLVYMQGKRTAKIKGLEKEVEDARKAQKTKDVNSSRSDNDAHHRLQELSKK